MRGCRHWRRLRLPGSADEPDRVQRACEQLAQDDRGPRGTCRGRRSACRARAVGRYNQRLYRTARAILRDDAEAEDAVQEAWLKELRAFRAFARSRACREVDVAVDQAYAFAGDRGERITAAVLAGLKDGDRPQLQESACWAMDPWIQFRSWRMGIPPAPRACAFARPRHPP